ncbi:MAG: transcription termination factor Rho [Prevotella sp.]|nr:transcription termination factor Rho [Prevotella sp.]
MYTKQELEQMDVTQLMDIASQLGVKVSQNDELETVIYDILDKAAIDSAANETVAPKRKRTRIAKKDPDHVYTVNGKDGENHDVKSQKGRTVEAPSLFSDLPVGGEKASEAPAKVPDPLAAFPKHRGRKSKAELAAIAAAEAAMTASKEEAEMVDDVPEATHTDEADASVSTELLEQLQEKMARHNEDGMQSEGEQMAAEGVAYNNMNEMDPDVWMDDPGDGTDFITVVDLPIEDQSAIPTLDIFDRPLAPQQPEVMIAPVQQQPAANGGGRYDFSDIITGNGVLEILQDGYGFLRSSDYNYLSSPDDIYVSPQQIKRYSLKTGDVVDCTVRPPHDNEKYFAMSTVNSINGRNPEEVRDRVSFEHLTPLFPEEKFQLTGDAQTTNPSTRIVDLFAPIGKGQRALIVAQPKTGKTILMKNIANAIAANHPEAYIMMLLIDERPEEVTDMARTVNAEVIASTFDEPADRHVKIAGIVLEKAKRMVECGHDVVIFLDSITRLARAYNTVAPASGKVLTGGVDANALQKPKRFFGAARKIENGGSLTIIATALVDTGSKMDEVIFEEFKGTGNSEIQLDRMLSNKRIFPSMNLVQSSTRRDDLLQDQTTLNRMWIIRKFIAEMNPIEAMNTVYDRLVQSKNNEEFLMSMNG